MRIGIFDSGIGGLTVHRELRTALPGHDLHYLGDTARVPYGTRSPETVRRYSFAVASYLAEQGAEALVIACNTATTWALDALSEAGAKAQIPVFGVVDPGVTAALEAHASGSIAILGTEGTIRGRAYQRALADHLPEGQIQAVACPLFVPLAEEGWIDGEVPRAVAERYLAPLRGSIDTAILGCTHYPLLKAVVQEVLPDVTLVDSAECTARAVRAALGPGEGEGTEEFTVTDHIERFQSVGTQFLGRRPEPVTWVDVGPCRGAFEL